MNTLRQFAASLRSVPVATSWYMADIAEALGKQPAAIVLEKPADTNIVEGAIVAGVPLLCEPERSLINAIPHGASVTVDGAAGTIERV